MGRSRDAAGIVMVLMIAGVLYGTMMAVVYFFGVFFVSVMARIFSWIAHLILLAVNNTEHEIQTRFAQITRASIALKSGQKQSVSLLIDAGRGEWTDNLSSKIRDSFAVISEMAGKATDQTVELRDILENSKYKDIFNFVKYGKWIQGQILSPIEEILLLLQKNRDAISHTITSLDVQIAGIPLQTEGVPTIGGGVVALDPSLQKPLILQKERFEMQMGSIAPMIEMLEGYRAKLTIKR
jgi:hypothetical protein